MTPLEIGDSDIYKELIRNIRLVTHYEKPHAPYTDDSFFQFFFKLKVN